MLKYKFIKKEGVAFKVLKREKGDYILYLPGLPNSDSLQRLGKFLPANIINLFYPGTWFSEGIFLSEDFNDKLLKGVRSLVNDGYRIKAVMASSFGSYALKALAGLSDKLIILSPVFDTYAPKNKESITDLFERINGFYKTVFHIRMDLAGFMKRLDELDIYNELDKIRGKEILIIINEDDYSVNSETAVAAAKELSKHNKVLLIKSTMKSHGYKLLSDAKVAKQVMKWINS